MTPQEAIKILEVAKAECEWNAPLDYQEAFDMAISALQVQDVSGTNVGDMISRWVAIEAAEKESQIDGAYGYMDTKSIIDMLEQLPSAQPETAKRIVGKSRDGMTFWYQCDMCNEPVDAQDNFCRGCGRRLTDG